MPGVNDTLREFILTNYLPGESPANLKDDTPLLTSGILDSLAALGLASFIQERYGIELDVYDTSVERFNRITDIVTLLARKQAAAAERGISLAS